VRHATDPRVVGVLEAVRDASDWKARPSPAPDHAADGDKPVRGRGVSMLFRHGAYWACVCEISVVPSTGFVQVERCVMAVDPGIVINPKQLKRQVEGGAVMGVSHALKEEVTFDESGVTAADWLSYPILTMAETPEIKVVLLNRPEVGSYAGGSEAANALAAPAIAAAFHDATGKVLRKLPLTPEYVQAALQT
jgi:CO/xanthine dehydrogenase Mo-binding subunit